MSTRKCQVCGHVGSGPEVRPVYACLDCAPAKTLNERVDKMITYLQGLSDEELKALFASLRVDLLKCYQETSHD